MLDVPTYSQRDPRWKNNKLGFSTYTLGQAGCLVTALSALITHITGTPHTPDRVNEDLRRAKAFSGALLIWSRVPIAYPQLKWIWRGYNYSNWQVSTYVYIRKLPVLVEVNASKIGASKHWVLFVGGQKEMCPWLGKIIPTSTYPLTGFALYQRS